MRPELDPGALLWDPSDEKSSCGVGFITRKDGVQKHSVISKAREALCSVPHRGGMSALGVGDGGGVSMDLSLRFFRKITGRPDLRLGRFCVGNFFLPTEPEAAAHAARLIERTMTGRGFGILTVRDVPVDNDTLRRAAVSFQLPIRQWVFSAPEPCPEPAALDHAVQQALLHIEAIAFTKPELAGLYPLSLSARTQVLKGRLSSPEVIDYFTDLGDPDHAVHTLYFHTRFSTNTDPHPTMAQPFRFLAHNGELNTDKKNRIAQVTAATAQHKSIVRPPGQSDSCRLDQTVAARVIEDRVDLVTAIVSMMPPAWENDSSLSEPVRAMFEYFSLVEEKNDGPAAVVFGDGTVIGARLDRLGLRPLRTVETTDYLCVFSEAGQIAFPPETVIARGRVSAGGMIYYDHREHRTYTTRDAYEKLAAARDYGALLAAARIDLADVEAATGAPGDREPSTDDACDGTELTDHQRYRAYHLDQESFRYFVDPMLSDGAERVSAMGFGNAINALTDIEPNVARFFSQRFAQVTNPPLDSIREADGMTLRVALGARPGTGPESTAANRQIVLPTPILGTGDLDLLRRQDVTPVRRFDACFPIVAADDEDGGDGDRRAMVSAVDRLGDEVVAFAESHGGIAVLSDRGIAADRAAIPIVFAVSALNQRLIAAGLRLRVSLVADTGQVESSHHLAATLGFGAAAVHPHSIARRAASVSTDGTERQAAFGRWARAAEKSLMKTMGRVGLCTVESYIGGEFFEPNFLDTADTDLRRWFPDLRAPVGGVGLGPIAASVGRAHRAAVSTPLASDKDLPLLGLFKERADGAGHSFGATAVRKYADLTGEKITLTTAGRESPSAAEADRAGGLRLLTLGTLSDAFGLDAGAYADSSYDRLSADDIDAFVVTDAYRSFAEEIAAQRAVRPSALRDILALPLDVTSAGIVDDFVGVLHRTQTDPAETVAVRGLRVTSLEDDAGTPGSFHLTLDGDPTGSDGLARVQALAQALADLLGTSAEILDCGDSGIIVVASGTAIDLLRRLRTAQPAIALADVQPAHEITATFASGAMSHGALVAPAHEAVAHGTNMVGGLSNSGEGGEHMSRYGTIRASAIKQFASGRFGIWAGYLADPMLRELEIKIGQGAKPGEGGQLPAPKVTVEIAAARGGTPGVELVSPPPHHDTYSIEDLAQLIHDCKAARVRVIVKLVSSEGIGTIAVGVAKAGADVINVAGNTGGTGAASVTSLRYAGRAAEIGLAEVHQALCANGLRQKVVLRTSGAHQTGRDVVTSALLGADSFEFGTSALMMIGCVMAKNCNIKCPAGLTTNPEVFDGDPRSMAQYLCNVAHDVREILAGLGLRSLAAARGRTDLLRLIDHPAAVTALRPQALLARIAPVAITDPVYLERDYAIDDALGHEVRTALMESRELDVTIDTPVLGNRNKSVGAQLAVDIERILNHELTAADAAALPSVLVDDRGRRFLGPESVRITTSGSAGLSYAAFCNDGMRLEHSGTCNDGVGKSMSGGSVIVRSPGGGSPSIGGNVLIGNFALFGATGGRLFVEGEAGDRFAVRNSGATAVVEGVGEFACEYMTNGAVLNLGGYGKGLGNGMSGGFLYQYDPACVLESRISSDSVIVGAITGVDDPLAPVHHHAVRQMLEMHVAATGSALGTRLLENWETERHYISYAMPRALGAYQDSDALVASISRRDLLDELSTALAAHQVRALKVSIRSGTPVADGVVPRYGETDNAEMYRLLNAFTVFELARQVASARLARAAGARSREQVSAWTDQAIATGARNLVLTEDFDLLSKVARYARDILGAYDADQLAALIAAKRVDDYKSALAQRNVWSMDAPGTYGWILLQDRKNREKLGGLPGFDELFAAAAVPDVAGGPGSSVDPATTKVG
ncbi:glutamate synthase-related protein [Gordonia sp. ABSL11-1]|uniref:glutamate synthase-related protein n=1 Tax=Gordonia sp. ABSL11-1 TaxID=3053924 RepID=UPI00257258BE|nr:glutamate synthase-related protein [Gordonia sp. ABSL11-1]MDL9946044.1 glutamate synthase-related protein [Gordonia sp. ABSL11-1]